jgi:hypothetical protein
MPQKSNMNDKRLHLEMLLIEEITLRISGNIWAGFKWKEATNNNSSNNNKSVHS